MTLIRPDQPAVDIDPEALFCPCDAHRWPGCPNAAIEKGICAECREHAEEAA